MKKLALILAIAMLLTLPGCGAETGLLAGVTASERGEAADAAVAVEVEGEEVEDVFDVADAVDMAVDVDVAVLGPEGAGRPGGPHLDARGLVDGARLVAYIIRDVTLVHRQQVNGLTCVHADHGPHGAGVADAPSVLVGDGEVTVGEEAVDVLHPRLYGEVLVLAGHLVHLDGQAGEHPRVVVFVEGGHAEASFGGVEAGAVQQVVAQHAQGQPSRKVHVERLGHKFVGSYLVHY